MPLIEDDPLANKSTLHMSHTRQQLPQQIRTRNRRKRYLERNPSYFNPDLESADPLLYDRLIRRFFTPTDREIERRQKGYAGSLEADLLRSEAKLDEAQSTNSDTTYVRTQTGEIVAQRDDEEELTRLEAYERWYEVMERRFLDGKDEDFDYEAVDGSEEYDDRAAEERERQEEWFDDEEPSFFRTGGEEEGEGDGGEKRKLEGETGIQDF